MLQERTDRWMLPRCLFVATFALIAAHASPTLAATSCNSGVTFSTNTTLSVDYEQTVATGTPCITLTNGADLDLNGKKITCKGGYIGACGVAINATAAGSVLSNSSPNVKAITGNSSSAWDVGVQNAEEIRNLRIERAFTAVASNYLTAMDHNVITLTDFCVEATLSSNSAYIQNTLCEPNIRDALALGYGDRKGIQATGTTTGSGPAITKNMVTHAEVGIYGYNRLQFTDNIVCNEHDGSNTVSISIDQSVSQSGSHNLCCNVPDIDADDCEFSNSTSGGFNLWP